MSVGSTTTTTTTTTLARQQTRPAAPGLPRWAACFGPMLGYDTTPQTPRPVAKQRSSRHSASAEGGEPAVAEPEAPSPVEAALAEVEQRWGPGSVGRFARGTAALRLHVLWLGLAGLLLPPTLGSTLRLCVSLLLLPLLLHLRSLSRSLAAAAEHACEPEAPPPPAAPARTSNALGSRAVAAAGGGGSDGGANGGGTPASAPAGGACDPLLRRGAAESRAAAAGGSCAEGGVWRAVGAEMIERRRQTDATPPLRMWGEPAASSYQVRLGPAHAAQLPHSCRTAAARLWPKPQLTSAAAPTQLRSGSYMTTSIKRPSGPSLFELFACEANRHDEHWWPS